MDTKLIRGKLYGSDLFVEYRLSLPEIGKGGNAWVYRAHADDGTGIDSDNYIIKILRPAIDGITFDDDFRLCFTKDKAPDGQLMREVFEHRCGLMLNEARKMHEYQRESICMNISAIFELGGTLAVAMPAAGGQALSEEKYEPITDDNRLLAIIEDVLQIAERVRVLHNREELHMDISPDNLFRHKNGAICLLDFGSICKANTAVSCYSRKQGFSAPETEYGRYSGVTRSSFGFETDIYSIAAVMYYLMFGKTFDRRAPGAYRFVEINTLPVNEGIKELLRDLLKYALAFTPEYRCHNTDELCILLSELKETLQKTGMSNTYLFQRSIETHDAFLSGNELPESGGFDEVLLSLDRPDGPDRVKKLLLSKNNIMLTGDSGSGKTALMMLLWDELLRRRKKDRAAPVPLFIDTSCYPDNDNWRGGDHNESFIMRQICVSCFKAAGIASCPPDILSGILCEFTKEKASAEYCVLLDGYDEIMPESRYFLKAELERLGSFSNLRIIMTSRDGEETPDGFYRCRFNGLSSHEIINYLGGRGFSNSDRSVIEQNSELMRLLRYPLYLTLVCRMKEKGTPVVDITRSGQLLDRYFSSDSISDMGEIARLNRIAKGREKQFSAQLRFIMDYLVPYIAYRTYIGKYKYSVDKNNFDSIIAEALDRRSGWFASEMFLCAYPDNAETILSLYSSDSFLERKAAANRITRLICSVLCVMTYNDSTLRFVNQTAKAYFAAKFFCIALEICASSKDTSVLTQICENTMPGELTRMAGDIMCANEYYCQEAVDTLRLFKNDNRNSVVTANIISAISACRGNLDGLDLSGLDLTECRLYGVSCRNSKFDGAVLNDRALIGAGTNIYTAAASPDASEIYLLSGDGWGMRVDASSGAKTYITFETSCDMCVSASSDGEYLFTLGRRRGRPELCVEVFSTDGTIIKSVPIDAVNFEPSMQFSDIIAVFSDDHKMLAIARCPVYKKKCGELLCILLDTGETYSYDCPNDIVKLSFAGRRLHMLTASREDISLLPACDDTDIQSENKIYDVLSHVRLIRKDNELVLYGGDAQSSLNIDSKIAFASGTRFTLYSEKEQMICLVSPKKDEVSYIAYFDGIVPRRLHGEVRQLCASGNVLMSRTERHFDGTSSECFGLYDYVHENWIVRETRHRGMQCGAVCGEYMLMTRGSEAVICDARTGKLTCSDVAKDGARVWLSDGGRVLYEYSAADGIQLSDNHGNEYIIDRQALGAGRKAKLSVLNISANLDRAIIQLTENQSKKVFTYSMKDRSVTELKLANDKFGETQAHIISEDSAALLSEIKEDGEKKYILQILFADRQPLWADITHLRCQGSTMLLLFDRIAPYIVTFRKSRRKKPWRYGAAVVTRVNITDSGLSFEQTGSYPCCCVNNPRVTCRYGASRWLVLKRRFTGSEYSIIDIRTGEEKTLFIDAVRFEGSSFDGALGLSEETLEILRKAGAIGKE